MMSSFEHIKKSKQIFFIVEKAYNFSPFVFLLGDTAQEEDKSIVQNMDSDKKMDTLVDGEKSSSQEKEMDITQDKTKNTSKKIDTLTYHQVGEDERILTMR